MKTQYLMTVALGTLLVVIGQANADEKELSKNQVPKAVITAFEKAFPKAKDVEFEQEMFRGKAAYEVEYKEDGKEYELLYSAEGALLQKEEKLMLPSYPNRLSKPSRMRIPKPRSRKRRD